MPSTALRQSVLKSPKTVVVKVGTALLTGQKDDGSPCLNLGFIDHIAEQITTLQQRGIEVVLVSSGAVGAGCVELGLRERPTDVADLQACAAVGQLRLMTRWHQALQKHNPKSGAGQLLLSQADFNHRKRFLHMRNCVTRLLKLGLVPVLNENDTVAVAEIRFSDNDHLATLMANAVCADALIILTGVDGLLDEAGNRIDLVTYIDEVIALTQTVTHGVKSSWGTGGMQSKLQAVRDIVDAGEIAVIANGNTEHVLTRLLDGDPLGTVFAPADKKLDSKHRWIGFAAQPVGSVTIDAGAMRAIVEKNKSLLAKGITDFNGVFEAGDVVLVNNEAGQEVARGLPNYSSKELASIAGKHSQEFSDLLPRASYTDFINRDNLVVRSE